MGPDIAAIENRATISRTTAGVSKAHGLDAEQMELLHRYTRDVHSTAIARRPGIHLYRHFSFGPLRGDLLRPVGGISYEAPDSARLTGAGHLDYLDERALQAFYDSPGPQLRARLLDDIHVLGGPPGRTTTYRTTAGNAHTYLDRTGEPTPQGPAQGRYAVFLRRRGGSEQFRPLVRSLAELWSATDGVLRLRLHLFDDPDMAVESAAGYPVFPAPVEEHYQAWIDLVVTDEEVVGRLAVPGDGPDAGTGPDGVDAAAVVSGIHLQPVPVVYTYVWNGRPTEVGLRGYPAYELIRHLGADNQRDPGLLRWLYGPVVDGAS